MPTIRPSADLRNRYNENSTLCHQYQEPVYITKNGTGDLAVLSIEAYERLAASAELYTLLGKGLAELEAGQGVPADQAFSEIESEQGL